MSPTNQRSFFLQVGAPAVLNLQGREVQDLQDAIGVIFPFPTEYWFLHWNSVPIALNYKYDLSDHSPIIVDILSRIQGGHEGTIHETLASSDLLVDLNISCVGDHLECAARWGRARGDLDSLNRVCSALTTTRLSFLAEWNVLLAKVLGSINNSGIQIADRGEVTQLASLHHRIQRNGYEPYLYPIV